MFHVTLKLGRSDSLVVGANSSADILTYFNIVSKAVVTSIKKIVYSKEYNINYTPIENITDSLYSEVLVFAKTKTYSKVFRIYNVKKSVSEDDLISMFQSLTIESEKIEDIYNVVYIA